MAIRTAPNDVRALVCLCSCGISAPFLHTNFLSLDEGVARATHTSQRANTHCWLSVFSLSMGKLKFSVCGDVQIEWRPHVPARAATWSFPKWRINECTGGGGGGAAFPLALIIIIIIGDSDRFLNEHFDASCAIDKRR